jgi:tetratricopeptide (TPR) repeat protein
MKKIILLIHSATLYAILSSGLLFPQAARSDVNNGVDLYTKGKYIDSEIDFKKGLQKAPTNFNSSFDLGDSYYKEGKYDEAIKSYASALSKTNSNELKAKTYHNIGNALLKDEKYKESVGAYANSLKLNPKDEQTKYNLSYALSMMKNQNQKDKDDKKNKNDKDKDKNKQNQDNKNQNKDQNKNQNKDQNKNNQDQQKNQQNKNNQQNQPQPDKISKDQAEAIFNALNNDEKDLQKQLRKMKGNPVKTSKDW